MELLFSCFQSESCFDCGGVIVETCGRYRLDLVHTEIDLVASFPI